MSLSTKLKATGALSQPRLAVTTAIMVRNSILAPQIGAALGAALLAVIGMSQADSAPARLDTSTPDLAARTQPVVLPPLSDVHLGAAASPEISPQHAGTVDRVVTSAAITDLEPEVMPPLSIGQDTAERAQPMLAIIIDDIGLDLNAAEQVLALDYPVTVSILPYADSAPLIAEAARMLGKDVFLHLPMEPMGDQDPGPGALLADMDTTALQARLDDALANVPGASGFNNHMGSRLTRDQHAMQAVFGHLTQDWSSLTFVDSVTHKDTLAADIAQANGFTAFSRQVFLDHNGGEEAAARLNEALDRALADGEAIAIGHPYPQTLAALEALREQAQSRGVQLVTMVDYARQRRDVRSSG